MQNMEAKNPLLQPLGPPEVQPALQEQVKTRCSWIHQCWDCNINHYQNHRTSMVGNLDAVQLEIEHSLCMVTSHVNKGSAVFRRSTA